MKVLVTGGAGFIGSHIVEHYQHKAHVVVLDDLRSGSKANLNGLHCEFIHGSILDRSLLRDVLGGVNYVFHLAALTSVAESMEHPVEYARVNTVGTLNVLEAAVAAGVKKLVFSSSAAVYGDSPVVPKEETMAADPKSPYAMTKLDGEFYCRLFAETGRISTVSLRYFNVFGPRQNPNSSYAAAVPVFVERALRNEPLIINGDGEQTRDFVLVDRVASANAFFAESNATGIFNVGSGRGVSVNALARAICQAADSRSECMHGPERPGDVRHSVASIAKLKASGCNVFTDGEDSLEGIRDFLNAVQAARSGGRLRTTTK